MRSLLHAAACLAAICDVVLAQASQDNGTAPVSIFKTVSDKAEAG
jgi:hypothetical protein